MSVPNTNTFTLQDVATEIYGDTNYSGKNLVQCFASATGTFDPNYVGSKNGLINFRNYNHISRTNNYISATIINTTTFVLWASNTVASELQVSVILTWNNEVTTTSEIPILIGNTSSLNVTAAPPYGASSIISVGIMSIIPVSDSSYNYIPN